MTCGYAAYAVERSCDVLSRRSVCIVSVFPDWYRRSPYAVEGLSFTPDFL